MSGRLKGMVVCDDPVPVPNGMGSPWNYGLRTHTTHTKRWAGPSLSIDARVHLGPVLPPCLCHYIMSSIVGIIDDTC